MKITNLRQPKLICRSGGGLHVGLRIHFPVHIWDGGCDGDAATWDNHVPTNMEYSSVFICIGLVFWEFGFHIDYNHKPIEPEV